MGTPNNDEDGSGSDGILTEGGDAVCSRDGIDDDTAGAVDAFIDNGTINIDAPFVAMSDWWLD